MSQGVANKPFYADSAIVSGDTLVYAETNQKEPAKEPKILSPHASASANIVIYNSLVININLKGKEPKPEGSDQKQDPPPTP